MADSKLSDLTALGEAPADGDLLYVSDQSESQAADRSKKMTIQNLFKSHTVVSRIVCSANQVVCHENGVVTY